MHVIGLTGSIASGKSTASAYLKQKGCPVIDCDALVHELQASHPLLKNELRNIFPKAFINDRLDRQKLSQIVFSHPDALKKIEDLTMPYVMHEIHTALDTFRKQGAGVVIIDAPLLFETQLNRLCDSTICLYVDTTEQKKRALARPEMTEEKYEFLIQKQMPTVEKKKKATYLILSDTIEGLHNQLDTILMSVQTNHHMPLIGFYAGSFDPLTKGHWNLICSAIHHCDKVYIGIGVNPDKKTLFSPPERVKLIHQTVEDFKKAYEMRELNNIVFSETEKLAYLKLKQSPEVLEVVAYEGMTIDAALKVGANTLLRGERNANDHEYEARLTTLNQKLLNVRNRELGAFTLTPDNQQILAHISSSDTKMLCESGEYIVAEEYVSPTVHEALMEKYLQKEFLALCHCFNIPSTLAADSFQELTLVYKKDRAYHTLSHVARQFNFLQIYESLCSLLKNKERALLKTAVFFHDYDLHDKNKSIKKAQTFLKKGTYEPNDLEVLSALIGTTNHRTPNKPETLLQKMAFDMNLSILGTHTGYFLYVQKIREEFKTVPIKIFAKKRLEILKQLQNLSPLYQTSFFRNMFEETAWENIEKEINLWHSFLHKKQV